MIAFLHVPKTGGTSLRQAFEAAGRSVWRPRGPRYQGTIKGRVRAEVATGHLTFSALASIDPAEMFTVLREPVQRFMSHYFVEAGLAEHDYWPDPDVVPDNIAARLLQSSTDPLGPIDLDSALANLERLDHIGFTDQLNVTFRRYRLKRERVGNRDKRDAPPWLVNAAHERTRLDAAVYRRAKELT